MNEQTCMDNANMANMHDVVLIRFVHHLMLSLGVLLEARMLSLEVLLEARNIQEMLADSSSAVTIFMLKPIYCVVIAHDRNNMKLL